jgi:HEPN domain-containing protein
MGEHVQNYFDDAIKKLDQAHQELCRPEEDVVSFLVCKNSQFAIENFLKGFLVQNDIDPCNFSTIDSLYEQCKNVNKRFEKINLSKFDCSPVKSDSRYCNDSTKVSQCFDIANSLKTFLRREELINQH